VGVQANIGPGAETGLGKHTFQNFTDEDLEAIFACLPSMPALKNRVTEQPPPEVPAAGAVT